MPKLHGVFHWLKKIKNFKAGQNLDIKRMSMVSDNISIHDLLIKKLGVEFILKVESKELDPSEWEDMILLKGKKVKKLIEGFKKAGFCDEKGNLKIQESSICKMSIYA